jgi:hypothetical protein
MTHDLARLFRQQFTITSLCGGLLLQKNLDGCGKPPCTCLGPWRRPRVMAWQMPPLQAQGGFLRPVSVPTTRSLRPGKPREILPPASRLDPVAMGWATAPLPLPLSHLKHSDTMCMALPPQLPHVAQHAVNALLPRPMTRLGRHARLLAGLHYGRHCKSPTLPHTKSFIPACPSCSPHDS